jgi:hypothetical protein
MEAVKAADLFGDAKSPKKAAQAHEVYLETLNKSLANPSTSPNVAPSADPAAQIEALVANKSLSPEALGSLNAALAAQRTASADMIKDITLTSPLSTSFAAFDLEAPAKLLTPRPTPLRNKIARKKGVGTSHRIKRLTGYTGTGTGGNGNIFPGVTETTTTTFGSIAYERGPKVTFSAEDAIFPYFSYSLSDSVTFDANFSGLGYQDLRQLSSTSTLYATMLMEERMMLMSRGYAANGGTGVLLPPTVTLTAATAGTGQTALGLTGTLYVWVTSDAGAFGESYSTAASVTGLTSGQVLNIAVSNVSGALASNVYTSTTNDPTTANYVGRIVSLGGVLQGSSSLATTNDNLVYNTTNTRRAPLASTDSSFANNTSAYATGYDGIIPQIFKGGTVNEINSQFSTSNPGSEFQSVFGTLFDSVKADPDEIWLNGSDRKQLSDAIKNGSTANYRINLQQDDMGNYVGGAVIGGLHNEITGKLVSLSVHPWLPQGVAPVLSYTLPIPDTEVSDVWASVNVQDYMGIQWPVTQFSYDFSTYFRGTFVGYAPAWNGIVTGIKSA